MDAMEHNWASSFSVSGLHLCINGIWSAYMQKDHIGLQELQVVTLMLHRMAFYFSGKDGCLDLDNSSAKAYLFNQGCTVFLLSRLGCYILNLANKHGITLIAADIPISM